MIFLRIVHAARIAKSDRLTSLIRKMAKDSAVYVTNLVGKWFTTDIPECLNNIPFSNQVYQISSNKLNTNNSKFLESYFAILDSSCSNAPAAHIYSQTELSIATMNKLPDRLALLSDKTRIDLITRAYRGSKKTVQARKAAQQEQIMIRRNQTRDQTEKVQIVS